jgi:hypothetical protein
MSTDPTQSLTMQAEPNLLGGLKRAGTCDFDFRTPYMVLSLSIPSFAHYPRRGQPNESLTDLLYFS